ncbi:MAG: hypothetical protein ACOCUV_01135, partial [bacterium]
VIKGLLDWIEADQHAPFEAILYTIKEVINPYLHEENVTENGFFVYSLDKNDKKKEVINSSVALAAQIQRTSQYLGCDSLTTIWRNAADTAIASALKFVNKDKHGNWYWGYGPKTEHTNDLIHSSFIADALITYVKYDGSLYQDIDIDKIMQYTHTFYCDEKKRFSRFPLKQPENYSQPKLWDIGFALYLYSKTDCGTPYLNTLYSQINDYKHKEVYEEIVGNKEILIRHNAYLLLGLSYYLYK